MIGVSPIGCTPLAADPSLPRRRLAFLVFLVLFLLNDLVYAVIRSPDALSAADIAFRLSVLLVFALWPLGRSLAAERPPGGTGGDRAFAWACLVLLLLYGRASQWVVGWIPAGTGWEPLFVWTRPQGDALYAVDLLAGLFVVALTEELVSRKLAFSWLSRTGLGSPGIVWISAMFFAAAHWGSGLVATANAFLMGLAYMAAYISLKRLWPLVLAHWLENLVHFGPW